MKRAAFDVAPAERTDKPNRTRDVTICTRVLSSAVLTTEETNMFVYKFKSVSRWTRHVLLLSANRGTPFYMGRRNRDTFAQNFPRRFEEFFTNILLYALRFSQQTSSRHKSPTIDAFDFQTCTRRTPWAPSPTPPPMASFQWQHARHREHTNKNTWRCSHAPRPRQEEQKDKKVCRDTPLSNAGRTERRMTQ